MQTENVAKNMGGAGVGLNPASLPALWLETCQDLPGEWRVAYMEDGQTLMLAWGKEEGDKGPIVTLHPGREANGLIEMRVFNVVTEEKAKEWGRTREDVLEVVNDINSSQTMGNVCLMDWDMERMPGVSGGTWGVCLALCIPHFPLDDIPDAQARRRMVMLGLGHLMEMIDATLTAISGKSIYGDDGGAV